jgi:tRNA (guanine-N7-)-methyltransferase
VVAEAPPRIRSFVRRQGRFTPAQRQAFTTLWAGRGLTLGQTPIDVTSLFPGCERIVLEIGSGMGYTLAELAAREPRSGFIGVEVHRPGVGKLLALAEEQGLGNLRVFCEDAVEVLQHGIADGVLDAVLLFFPDPWHKKRHHKRRLVQPAFVELLRRRLRPGGMLHMATDWEDYAQQMLEVLEAAPGWRNTAGPGQFSPRPDSRPVTRFEERGRRLGHTVRDLVFLREDGSSAG